MSERKINLEEIFDLNFDHYTETGINVIGKENFIEICNHICEKLLKLASQNAEVEIMNGMEVNKQSILDTIKQVE